MISPTKGKTVNIVLDGNEVEVPAGINLVDAAALFNKEIPHYCYHHNSVLLKLQDVPY